MFSQQDHRIEDLLFSFSYSTRGQASRCNGKIQDLVEHAIFPEMEKSFDQVAFGELNLELDRLEIDLGILTEAEISEDLGDKIGLLLVEALKRAIKEKLSIGDERMEVSSNGSPAVSFALLALKTFLLKGYFPAWADSRLNLYALLELLIASHGRPLGSLVAEVSLKSESARKRIAFLDSIYFDRIVAILVPGDAEWIVGYRDAYMNIHRTESRLTDPSENLRRALNLFILRFITENTGTKFNRLNFSDRFLKAIAAHYNLDFREFLREITDLLNKNTISTELYRDFREAVSWVGEKNNVPIAEDRGGASPNFDEFVAWLNQSRENEYIHTWVEDLASSGTLFSELSIRFPGFWKSLSKAGLTHLIRLLGGHQAARWLELIYSYLAWNTRQHPNPIDQESIVKAILHKAGQRLHTSEYHLSDLESWFFLLVSHGLEEVGTTNAVAEELLKMGAEARIPRAALLVTRARRSLPFSTKRAGRDGSPVPPRRNTINDLVSSEDGMDRSFGLSQLALLQYLKLGLLPPSFESLGRADLVRIVISLIKLTNSQLLDVMGRIAAHDKAAALQRLESLMETIDRGDLAEFIVRQGGDHFEKIIGINEELVSLLRLDAEQTRLLDKLIWRSFVLEFLRTGRQNDDRSVSVVILLRKYFVVLGQLSKAAPLSKGIVAMLGKFLRAERAAIVTILASEPQAIVASRFWKSLTSLQTLSVRGEGLLDLRQLCLSRQSMRMQDLKLSLANPRDGSIPHHILKILQSDSVYGMADSAEWSRAKLDSIVLKLIHQDLQYLSKFSLARSWAGSRRLEFKQALTRVLLLSKHTPQPLARFFEVHRTSLFPLLAAWAQQLERSEWKKLTSFLIREAPQVLSSIQQQLGMINHDKDTFLHEFYEAKGENVVRMEELFLSIRASKLGVDKAEDALESLLSRGHVLFGEISSLLVVPSGFFSCKSSLMCWRKVILLSVFQLKMGEKSGQLANHKLFWSIFSGMLKTNRSAFGPARVAWDRLILWSSLAVTSKAPLLQFYRRTYLNALSPQGAGARQDAVFASILFYGKEGFLPWWSPSKTEAKLVTAMLFALATAPRTDALLWISGLSEEGIARILTKLDEPQLRRLLAQLSASRYRRQLDFLTQEVFSELHARESQLVMRFQPSDSRALGQYESKDLQTLSMEELDSWIKRQINDSREEEVLTLWLDSEPKIVQQVSKLLGWSPFFFYGNLTPGKWRLWVLSFAYEFYVRRKNSFSSVFLSHFLRHASRSHANVSWKRVFHRLLGDSRFCREVAEEHLEEIKLVFPGVRDSEAAEPAIGERVKVSNAGLILCWPFLSVLFSRLNLSVGGVIPLESQPRAVYLLQYLVYGHTDFPEYELVLNKILVGMKAGEHLEKVELEEQEKQMVMSLLNGMKSNWEKMKNASAEAIRETFLQREGTLEFGSASNILRVPKTGVDVLLDSISWNISVVKLPWMEKSLEVKWR